MVLERRVWQVGTGDDARPYNEYLVKHGVVLLGSGTDGKWSQDNSAYANRSDIRSFADRAAAGDLVVARRGLSRALALGVFGEYGWSPAFDDIEGWDLQHYPTGPLDLDLDRRGALHTSSVPAPPVQRKQN